MGKYCAAAVVAAEGEQPFAVFVPLPPTRYLYGDYDRCSIKQVFDNLHGNISLDLFALCPPLNVANQVSYVLGHLAAGYGPWSHGFVLAPIGYGTSTVTLSMSGSTAASTAKVVIAAASGASWWLRDSTARLSSSATEVVVRYLC